MAIILEIILMSKVNKSVMSQELHGTRGRSVDKKRCKDTTYIKQYLQFASSLK